MGIARAKAQKRAKRTRGFVVHEFQNTCCAKSVASVPEKQVFLKLGFFFHCHGKHSTKIVIISICLCSRV